MAIILAPKYNMKKSFLLSAMVILVNITVAQVKFEKGYYLTNNNETVNGLIKNLDWKNNPSSFIFKASETSDPVEISLKDAKEFGISDVFKYVRHTFKMDRASAETNKLEANSQPVFKEETQFLLYLIEGKGSLLVYQKDNFKRFFYRLDGSNPDQLVYKRYLAKSGSIGENNMYKQQLINILGCTSERVDKIDYNRIDLINYFIRYNECENSDIKTIKKTKKLQYSISARPGISYSTLTTSRRNGDDRKNFDVAGFYGRYGAEVEIVLPFYANRVALTVEPTFKRFTSKTQISYKGNVSTTVVFEEVINIYHNSFQVPLGARYYLFLPNDSRLFVNSALVIDIPISSRIDFETSQDLAISYGINLGLGMGYKIKNFSLEARYLSPRNLLGGYRLIGAKFNSYSLILGYTFAKTKVDKKIIYNQ